MSDRRQKEDRRQISPKGFERRMGERRDSHRVDIEVEVREGTGPFHKHLGNISIGGMFFKKPLSLPTGAVLQLRFSLPGMNKRLQVQGEVVEITSVGKVGEMGTRVRFIDLELQDELLIARYLDDNEE